MAIKKLGTSSFYDGAITGAKLSATDLTTSNVVEGTNLYFTNTRVYSNVTSLGYITSSSLSGYATNSQLTSYATTSYVNSEVANLVASAPAALDTLNELAAALGNDSSFSTTVVNSLSNKANTASLTTANVTEVTNLYFTNTRARAAISVTGAGTYDSSTGVITVTGGVTSVGGATGAVSNAQLISSVIPTQTANTGKYLTTDGSITSWSSVAGGVTVSATAPSSPTSGMVWLDTTVGTEYTYITEGDSSQWVELGPSKLITGDLDADGGFASSVYLSTQKINGGTA